MLQTEMSPAVMFAANRNPPEGETAAADGPVPALNGEPVRAVSSRFVRFMAKAETFEDPELATYRNAPLGVTAVAESFEPTLT